MSETNKYPEHAKLRKVHERSQAIGEFLEWLEYSRGWILAEPHKHDEGCRDSAGYRICQLREDEYIPAPMSIRGLLAEFFSIDEQKLEDEKQAMLAEMRQAQSYSVRQG